jgi:hypothetical protein
MKLDLHLSLESLIFLLYFYLPPLLFVLGVFIVVLYWLCIILFFLRVFQIIKFLLRIFNIRKVILGI